MNKKSQISVLVIFGLIILVSSIFLINTQYDFKKSQLDEQPEFIKGDIIRVKNFVEFCLERQSEHAFNWVMVQGGYYESGKYNEDPVIKYLVKDNIQIEVEKETILNGMKLYLEDTLPYCINDFDHLESLDINSGEQEFFVNYYGNQIQVNLIYPLNIKLKNNDFNFNVEKFSYDLDDVNLNTVVDDVNEYTDEFTKEFDGLAMAEYVLNFEDSKENLKLEIAEVQKSETEASFTNFFLYNFSNRKVPFAFSIHIKEDGAGNE